MSCDEKKGKKKRYKNGQFSFTFFSFFLLFYFIHMPFRCKCGRTFEKLDTFGSHTSGCAPFHHRRLSSTENNLQQQQENNHNKKKLLIQTDPTSSYFNQRFILLSPLGNKSFFNKQDSPAVQPSNSSPRSAPIFDGFMMPTALSIQNTFEDVRRRRSQSFSTANSGSSAATFE